MKNIVIIIFIVLFSFILLNSIYVRATCNRLIEGMEQVYATTDQYNPQSTRTCNGRKAGTTIFKPNNRQYSCQGAVDSSTRLDRLKQTTVNKNAASLKAAFGSEGASACAYRGISDTPYCLKSKYQPPICSQKNLGAIYRQNHTVCFHSQSSDLEKHYTTRLTYY